MHQLKVVAHTLNFRSLFVFRYSLFINIHSLRIAFAAFSHAFFFPETFIPSMSRSTDLSWPWLPRGYHRNPATTSFKRSCSMCRWHSSRSSFWISSLENLSQTKSQLFAGRKKTIHLVCLLATFIHRNIIKIKTKIEFWYVTPWLNDFSIY